MTYSRSHAVSQDAKTALSGNTGGRYRLLIADWAIPADVIALEHVREDGGLCLVYSTTVGYDFDDLTEMVTTHAARCGAA